MNMTSIIAWRQFKGYSQEDLARHAGLTRPNLSRIEKGLADPSFSTLKKLAYALSTSLSGLLQGPPPLSPLGRQERDAIARSVVNGDRDLPPPQREMADQIASVLIGFLRAHSAPGYRNVKRLKVDDGTKYQILKQRYGEEFGLIIRRVKKFVH